MMTDFIGGDTGEWEVIRFEVVKGEPLETVSRLQIIHGSSSKMATGLWSLRGFNSNARYTERIEMRKLTVLQQGLNRPAATCAALIPIRKTSGWWELAQDERRAIFEGRSHHTEIGLGYLPAIARKLYHCRDIGEPFDFLTWFEYSPNDSYDFENLVQTLRKSEEWLYVDREIDIRLRKRK